MCAQICVVGVGGIERFGIDPIPNKYYLLLENAIIIIANNFVDLL